MDSVRKAKPRSRWATMARAAGCTVAVLVVAARALWFRPDSLGGRTGYVIVSGQSMEPAMHGGDFVVVRRQPTYRVGDVVSYRIPMGEFIGRRIIHRIVGGSATDGFILRGDNKPDN